LSVARKDRRPSALEAYGNALFVFAANCPTILGATLRLSPYNPIVEKFS
jgi:hypothetical protein